MNITILDGAILNPGDVSWEPLQNLGSLQIYDSTSPSQFAKRVKGAEVVLVNKTLVSRQDIPALQDCKLIGVLATGANNLDLTALRAADMPVCNVPGYGVEDVAQHALALLMELSRHTGLHTESVLAGEWQKSQQWCYWKKTPLSLSGLTLGIIGFGAIGQALGRIAHALGMRILAYARHSNARVEYPFQYASLQDIFSSSNVISLHCPLTPETSEIINKEHIDLMPDGVLIINTARGGLLDEEACATALMSGKLGGLGVDVLSAEPPLPANPLLKAPNVLITPHMAWATKNARQKIIDIMAHNIRSFFAAAPVNIIN